MIHALLAHALERASASVGTVEPAPAPAAGSDSSHGRIHVRRLPWTPYLLIALGVVLVPWTIFLTVTQPAFGVAADLRLAKAGMVVTALILAISTAWALAAGSEWSGPLAMASLTFWGGLGVNGLIAVPVSFRVVPPSFAVPFWLASVAVVTCAVVLWHVMKRRVWRRPFARALAAILVACAAALLLIVWLSPEGPKHVIVHNGSYSWDLLDVMEAVALLGAGFALLRGWSRWGVIFGSGGAVLFVGDAWYNVMLSKGLAFYESLLFLVIGELPSCALCLVALVAAQRAMVARHPLRRQRQALTPAT
jgi:hypothetical protein